MNSVLESCIKGIVKKNKSCLVLIQENDESIYDYLNSLESMKSVKELNGDVFFDFDSNDEVADIFTNVLLQKDDETGKPIIDDNLKSITKSMDLFVDGNVYIFVSKDMDGLKKLLKYLGGTVPSKIIFPVEDIDEVCLIDVTRFGNSEIDKIGHIILDPTNDKDVRQASCIISRGSNDILTTKDLVYCIDAVQDILKNDNDEKLVSITKSACESITTMAKGYTIDKVEEVFGKQVSDLVTRLLKF